jgi:hypothetical protein
VCPTIVSKSSRSSLASLFPAPPNGQGQGLGQSPPAGPAASLSPGSTAQHGTAGQASNAENRPT